jgi:hypothetical protein
MWNLTEEKVD